MFKEEYQAVGNVAKGKVALLEKICRWMSDGTAGTEAGMRYCILGRSLFCNDGRRGIVYR